MAHWQQWFFDKLLASATTKHTTITNYYDRYDIEDDNVNKDGNDDYNDASVSGSYVPVSDPIMTPWYCRRGQ